MNRQFNLKYLTVGFVVIAVSLVVMRQDLMIGIYCLGIGSFLMQIATLKSYAVRLSTDVWNLFRSGGISLLIVSATAAVIAYILTEYTDPGPNAVWMFVPPLMAMFYAIKAPIGLLPWLVPLGMATWLLGRRGDGSLSIGPKSWNP